MSVRDYNLDDLGPNEFEELVQDLVLRILGNGFQFPETGSDAGRDGYFDGSVYYAGQDWIGRHVVQAKYRHRTGDPGKKSDGQWAEQKLRDELNLFWPDKSSPRQPPDYYFFATNARLTSARGRGSLDKFEALLEARKSGGELRDYAVWSYKKLCSLLADHEDIRERYGLSSPFERRRAAKQKTTPTKAPLIARTRLPLRHLTDLLEGREQEFGRLDVAWNGSERKNIVAIVAWGGIGKTSLVVHWKNKLLALPDHGGIERYFDWSFYSQGTRCESDAGAAKTASADLFLKEALEFFGDPALAGSNVGAWKKGERLAQLIGQHRTLLVLDGLEPLQDVRSGELRDEGLRALLRKLAVPNHGLCLITTRQHLPNLATWHQTTALKWELAQLTDEAGAGLLTKLGVNGTDLEKRDLSAKVKGHALTLTLLGGYLRKAHHGDIRRVDRVNFQKADERAHGGHAFRVMAAYELWFEDLSLPGVGDSGQNSSGSRGNKLGKACIAILRTLGLFDRPATPDCLATLRNPPIPGLTDALSSLDEDEWNEAVTHLVELNLVEEQAWEPARMVGYGEEQAKRYLADQERGLGREIGELQPFAIRPSTCGIHHSLDAHPLMREFFAKRLQETATIAWRVAHSRLFQHLRNSAPYWPDSLSGLQPLYQAVAHGCQAQLYEEALLRVVWTRIRRKGEHCFPKREGAFGADLAALSNFFEVCWTKPVAKLDETFRAGLLAWASSDLRALGRFREAYEAAEVSLALWVQLQSWKNAGLSSSDLSGISLCLGNVAGAVERAREGGDFAQRSRDAKTRIILKRELARDLFQAGHQIDALGCFNDADALQGKQESFGGTSFFHFEFLLASTERAAWQADLAMKVSPDRLDLLERCRIVKERVRSCSGGELDRVSSSLLILPLKRLTLCHIELYKALLVEELTTAALPVAQHHISAAVDGFRRVGYCEFQPRALLSRAWLRAVQGQLDLARADLDEAQQIAERGSMLLNMADIHLHRARLFRDKEELKRARALIERCGYWRRKEELEDAETVAANWPDK